VCGQASACSPWPRKYTDKGGQATRTNTQRGIAKDTANDQLRPAHYQEAEPAGTAKCKTGRAGALP